MLFNLYEGLCWFILPTLLIICNDIFAYLVGYFFGKTRLIALSPKKTWEGYLGGAVITFFGSQLVIDHVICLVGVCDQSAAHAGLPADAFHARSEGAPGLR